MKVLFDHNVPKQLRRFLEGHQVTTAFDMNWATLTNGSLLNAAEAAGFDVLVTADRNLSYQQNLGSRKLPLVVLETNSWSVLKQNTETVLAAVDRAHPGSFEIVPLE